MATVKKAQKAQFGRSVKKISSENYKVKEVTYPGGATKTKIKFNPKGGANFNTTRGTRSADVETERPEPEMKSKLKTGGSVSKAQAGKTVMQKLKSKYPSADTTAKGDVRGTEMNAYAPKKVVKQYSDTYDAFDKKFNKGKSYRAGGKIKKAQAGLGLKPSKPAGPIDPNGAWTKVQERTIAGTKMAKKGAKISKKK